MTAEGGNQGQAAVRVQRKAPATVPERGPGVGGCTYEAIDGDSGNTLASFEYEAEAEAFRDYVLTTHPERAEDLVLVEFDAEGMATRAW